MKLSHGIALLVLLWLFLVLRNAPAQWGIWLANPPAAFSGITGTIWSGRAANVVIPYEGSSYALGELTWDLHPSSLLLLRPCADVTTKLNDQQVIGVVCSSIGGDLQLRDMEVNVPAQAAELWLPARIAGEVLLRIDELTLEDDRITQVQGKGSWTNARFHNTQIWLDLGTLGFELAENAQGGMQAKIFDVEGPVQVNLQSDVGTDGSYVTRGDIQLRESAQPEIGQLLMHISEQVSPAHYRVEWTSG